MSCKKVGAGAFPTADAATRASLPDACVISLAAAVYGKLPGNSEFEQQGGLLLSGYCGYEFCLCLIFRFQKTIQR